jgi:hypothetical protein
VSDDALRGIERRLANIERVLVALVLELDPESDDGDGGGGDEADDGFDAPFPPAGVATVGHARAAARDPGTGGGSALLREATG